MTRSTVQQMVFSYLYKIRYHCHLQYGHQNDKKVTARMQNLLKIRGKMLEVRVQREEMKEKTKWLPLRKQNHVNFENILENRWIRWRVFAIYISNRDKTEVVFKN